MVSSIGAFFLLLTSGLGFQWHEFYVSVTNLEITENEINATTRIFVDDIELAIRAQGHHDWVLTEETMTDSVCLLYTASRISITGESVEDFEWNSRSIEGQGPTRTLVLKYSASISAWQNITYHSSILTELYEGQVNMVHLKRGNKRQSRNLDYIDTSWEFSLDE